MRSARPPAAAAEVFHKRDPRLGRARRNAGLRTVFAVFTSCFQDFNKSLSISLYSLRMDKRCTRMYNKARNQRSTAEAQMRANPADLKQKGARPMVDMEPAQQGQAVGIR